MNIQTQVSLFVTKEFQNKLDRIYRLGGNNRKIFEKWQGLNAGFQIENQRAFKRFPVTNHGENRIKSCFKYDLGLGYRLITIHKNKTIYVTYIGNHDDCDKWLNKNSGWTPVLAGDNSVRVVRNNDIGEILDFKNEKVPGNQKLIDRFELTSDKNQFLELLPTLIAVNISQIDCNVSILEVQESTNGIEDEKLKNTIANILVALLEDDKVQAKDLLDLHLNKADEINDLNENDEVKFSFSDEFYQIGSKEYEKALNHIAEKGTSLEWLLFMHPEQKKIVYKNYNGPVQLSGVSGSGKTCVALNRCIRLAEENPNSKLLFLTLNKSLVGLIKKLIKIVSPSKVIENQIDVLSMFELSQKLIVDIGKGDIRYFGEETDKLNEDIDEVFREYYRCINSFPDAKNLKYVHQILISNNIDAEHYIREEFDWIRSALSPKDRNKYLEILRVGRKFPFQKDLREQILIGLNLWEEKMTNVGIIDYLGLATQVHTFIDKIIPIYDHVIVDESQDFGTTELEIVKKLTKTGDNNLFLCGDIAQSVLPKSRSLKDATIQLEGRREKIMKNYRNTRQILEVAYEILYNNLSDEHFNNSDDTLEILDPQYANRSLNEPVLLKANSLEEEITYAVKMLEELYSSNKNHCGCIVFIGYKFSEIKNYANKIKRPFLDGNLDPLNEPIVFSDVEQAKGYEFDTVIIINCEKGILPAEGIHNDELYRIACQLYVSMTRAKNDLYLSYHSHPSDWLLKIEKLYPVDWCDVENIKSMELFPKPISQVDRDKLKENEIINEDEIITGKEFLYSKNALGLSIENQNKISELIDGKGLFSASRNCYIKWKDIKSAITDAQNSPIARSILGEDILKSFKKY